MDDHDYYISRFVPPGPEADSLWVNLTQLSGVKEDLVHNISGLYRYFDVSIKQCHIILARVR